MKEYFVYEEENQGEFWCESGQVHVRTEKTAEEIAEHLIRKGMVGYPASLNAWEDEESADKDDLFRQYENPANWTHDYSLGVHHYQCGDWRFSVEPFDVIWLEI